MKKFLLSLIAAAAALFATSCVNELEDGIKDNTGNGVTFEISASELASRAYGDGQTAAYLIYGVYEVKEGGVEFQNGLSNTTKNDNLKFVDGNATVTINLLDDTTYNVLFWAVSDGVFENGFTKTPAFTINWAEQTMAMNPNLTANVEGYDAFYGYAENVAAGTSPAPVLLNRPFAQLNIGTSDWNIAEAGNFIPAKSAVTIKNAPYELNIKTGSVTSNTKDLNYALNGIPDGTVNTDHKYLAMTYVLVGKDKTTLDVELTVKNDDESKSIQPNQYNGVPFARNYRTNLYGALLTNGSQFSVEIKDGFATTQENHTIVKSGYQFALALLRGENVILANDITVTKQDITDAQNAPAPVMSRANGSTPINVTINLGDHTISGAFTKGDGAVVNIANGVSAKLVGGIVKNTTENGDAVINNKGTLELENIEIIGAPIADGNYPAYAVISSGKLTVNEGTVVSSDRGAISLQDGADVTINGGDIKVTDALGTRALTAHVIYAYGSASRLTINNGNFAMKYNAAAGLGASIICPAGATIKVYGGNFNFAGQKGGQSGCFQNYMGYGAPVDVYGGTYNDNTVTKNLAAGYKAVESNDIWTVVKAE